jgi:hypothetical protein
MGAGILGALILGARALASWIGAGLTSVFGAGKEVSK